MRADDVAGIEPVLRAAYAMPRSYRERIEAHLRQRAVLPLVAEYDGRLAGAVFGNDYATSAYVSLMGVDPAFHGLGIGTALMAELMAWCDRRGFRDVRLDATPAGAPLYERFGFADFGETVVYTREGVVAAAPSAAAAAHGTVARSEDAATIARLDAAAFGADRTPVLEPLLAAHGALVDADGRGYAVVQRIAAGTVVGPWVALDTVAARDLLDAALAAAGDGPATLFVPSPNAAAVSLATGAGFAVRRTLRHMIRGVGAMPSPAVFGRANLGQG
jgi:GNAT superfamily N-acetyltransferase